MRRGKGLKSRRGWKQGGQDLEGMVLFKKVVFPQGMVLPEEMVFPGEIAVFPEESPLDRHRHCGDHPDLHLWDPSSR